MSYIECLVKEFNQKTIVCCVCHKVFCDDKSLASHFFSHFNPDGNLKPISLVRENKIKLFSASISVPVYGHDHTANEDLGSSKRAKLVWHNSQVPTSTIEGLRELDSTHRHHPYPSTLISHSPISRVPVNPVTVGDLARGKHPQTVMENKVEGHLASVARPFIRQLEKHTEEMTTDAIDVDVEELDLTLRL